MDNTLDAATEEHSSGNVRFAHFVPTVLRIFPFKANLFLDFHEFCKHERMSYIAFAMEIGQDLASFVPSVLIRKPTRGLGEEEKADEKDYSRDHLNSPGQAE